MEGFCSLLMAGGSLSMSYRLSNYVLTFRRHWALTQSDLAFLLGLSPDQISRLESEECAPTAHLLLGAEIIFGGSLQDLFPALYDQIEETVVQNLYRLGEKLEGDTAPEALRQRQLVDEALARALVRGKDTMDHDA